MDGGVRCSLAWLGCLLPTLSDAMAVMLRFVLIKEIYIRPFPSIACPSVGEFHFISAEFTNLVPTLSIILIESEVAIPTRFQRLACIQRWIEGSWSSIHDVASPQNTQDLEDLDNQKPESLNWLTAFSFQHTSPLTTQEWGKILDSQFCH